MKDLTISELKNSRAFQQKDYWVAPAYYMSNGVLGGYIFNTEDEANNEIVRIIKNLERAEQYVREEMIESQKKEAAQPIDPRSTKDSLQDYINWQAGKFN